MVIKWEKAHHCLVEIAIWYFNVFIIEQIMAKLLHYSYLLIFHPLRHDFCWSFRAGIGTATALINSEGGFKCNSVKQDGVR